MKNIILINNGIEESASAMEAAVQLANCLQANVKVISVKQAVTTVKVPAMAGIMHDEQTAEKHLIFPVTEVKENELGAEIGRSNACMVIATAGDANHALRLRRLLNRSRYPLLLIPSGYKWTTPKQLGYLTDLRYCRREVLSYLTELSENLQTGARVDHLSFEGVPDLVDSYAPMLFEERAANGKLKFNNIKSTPVSKATDVLIHTLKTDLLMLVHREYHCAQLLGGYISFDRLNALSVPVMVFPY